MTRRAATADEGQALLTAGEGDHSPTPPVSTAPPRETCAALLANDGDTDEFLAHPMHVCGLTEHDDKVRHACKDCPQVWPLPHPIAHSRQIVDRLLTQSPTQEVRPLSPTVVGTVERDPASEAIATAARRLVQRTGQQITEFNQQAWGLRVPTLETRIATRLEDVGLSPGTAHKLTELLLADVLSVAESIDAVLCEQVDMVMRADVARNLLPRISKVMKETDNG